MKDTPFKLDTLKDVHRMVDLSASMICCDEKSGYDHVSLSCTSQTYFGLQFAGWVFTFTTLPFGWKISPFIYQTIGMQVTTYLRHLNIENIQYIDHRLLIYRPPKDASNTSRGSHEHVYILLQILTRLGYTLALQKCQLIPSTSVKYLGFIIDSEKQAYMLPTEKKRKFKIL